MFPGRHDLPPDSRQSQSAIRPGGVPAHQWIESHSRPIDCSSHRSRRRCLLPLAEFFHFDRGDPGRQKFADRVWPGCVPGTIGFVTQPKKDKRDDFFVAAEVRPANLGISSIFLPCKALREYFYRIPQREGSTGQQTPYQVLQVPCTASPGELRVAFKLRQLELEAKHCPRSEYVLLECAFNILGDPGLRACYDVLLKDPEAPAIFPYGGFGSLLVSGDRSRDEQTFFARRIIAFMPERHRRRFHAPVRKCEFYSDRALYRDIRRRLELWIDPAVLHQVWDPTWNRWKRLLGAKMEVNATFVKSGKYRWHRGKWELVTWETALPSRLEIKLPSDFSQQVEAAKRTYHRFGQYAPALDKVRSLVERKPMEKAEIERILCARNVPGDFDIAQVNWRP